MFRSENSLFYLAFAAIYFIWGSTYLFNSYAISEIPPFTMIGARFGTAGLILFLIAMLKEKQWPSRKDWLQTGKMGLMFITIGTGSTSWALQFLDSGLTALLVAFQPLQTVLLMWVILSKRPTPIVLMGVVLGLAGMVLLIGQPQLLGNAESIIGIIAVGIGIFSWGYASVIVNNAKLPKNKTLGTAMQMLVGGGTLMLLGTLMGEWRTFDPTIVSTKAWFSLAYLIVFGSIIAFSSFIYLLHRTTPDKVATATYVNPVIAMLLGVLFNNEILTLQSVAAGILLLSGVFFINTNKGKQLVKTAKA